MNYILSSIILLVVTIIIIYLFSIDNNIDKFKNKIKETFTTIKSDKINYLNEIDSSMLLHFLKSYYPNYDNIMIPRRVFYTIDKINNGYILEDIQIIGFKLENNIFTENTHTITVKFIPIKNELFVGRYTLFGKNGNYYIELDNIPEVIIPEKKLSKKKIKKLNTEEEINVSNNSPNQLVPTLDNDSIQVSRDNDSIQVSRDKQSNLNPTFSEVKDYALTDILDMIPDIIHLSSDVEENTERLTTITPRKNHYA